MSGSTVRQITPRVDVGPGTGLTLTFATLPLAGSAVIVTLSVGGSAAISTVTSVTDSQGGNTYTVSVAASDVFASNAFIIACPAIGTPAGTFSITIDFSSNLSGSANALEWTQPLASPLERTGTNASTTGGQTSIAVTASGANANPADLVVAVLANNGTNNTNAGITDPASSGYTSIGVQQDVDDFIGYEASYKILTLTETSAASWSWTGGGSNSTASAIATFKGTAAAPSGTYAHRPIPSPGIAAPF